MADTHKTCRGCSKRIEGHLVCVRGFSALTYYHPACLVCSVCAHTIAVGDRYTVEKDGPKCHGCFAQWAETVIRRPGGSTAAHAVKATPTDSRGYVWQQVQLIEANAPPPPSRGPVKEDGAVGRMGAMGTCAKCSKPIWGTLLQLQGRRAGADVWLDLHQECHAVRARGSGWGGLLTRRHQCARCKKVFDDGQTYVRDTAGHTVCEGCYAADLAAKAAQPKTMTSEIQEGEQKALGTCPKCSKAVLLSATTVKGKGSCIAAKEGRHLLTCSRSVPPRVPRVPQVRQSAGRVRALLPRGRPRGPL